MSCECIRFLIVDVDYDIIVLWELVSSIGYNNSDGSLPMRKKRDRTECYDRN